MRNPTAVFAIIVVVLVAGAMNRTGASWATEGAAQDTAYLDRRISMLETRLYSIESSLRSLEQQAMSSRSSPAQASRDPEVSLLRSEIEILKSRLREIECGLARIDERTLSGAAREARRRALGQAQDPCRLDPERPVELTPRR